MIISHVLIVYFGRVIKQVENLNNRRSDHDNQKEGNQGLADRKALLFLLFARLVTDHSPLGNVLVKVLTPVSDTPWGGLRRNE